MKKQLRKGPATPDRDSSSTAALPNRDSSSTLSTGPSPSCANIDVDAITGFFLSLRFTDGAVKDFAELVRGELEAYGHSVFLCDAGFGEQFGRRIREALSGRPNFVLARWVIVKHYFSAARS